jgi:rRNA-processing protein FCF1
LLLRPGKSYDDAIRLLDDMVQGGLADVSNGMPHIGSPSFQQMMPPALLRYERWTEMAQRQLRETFTESRVIDRLRAERYWLIVGSPPALPRTASMIQSEVSELRSYFTDLANELREQKIRLGSSSALVLDTNDLLHYYRMDTIPWTSIYGKGVRVVLPHVVIDEIDAKSYSAGQNIQRRARGVYRMLERLLDLNNGARDLKLNDGTPFEVLADEIGHTRLPNNDDEIVLCATLLQQAISPNTGTIVTRDIGMRARALAQGLSVAKIPDKYLIREDRLATSDLEAALAEISEPTPGSGDDQ